MDTTTAERARRLKERRKAEGWKRDENWVPPGEFTRSELLAEIKKLVEEIDNRNPAISDGMVIDVVKARLLSMMVGL